MSQTATLTREKPSKLQGGPARTAYAGKEHRWAVLPSTRANGPIISLLPTLALWLVTILFNKSSSGIAFYDWLNANYTPFQINAWWSFAITTAVYWAGGLCFMALDLYDPLPAKVRKYKLQPDKRVTWTDYKKVLWIVARNQLVVALPMSVAMATWRPLPTGNPLPGAWKSIGTFIFCLLCEEVGFYVVHRAVHSKYLYSAIHKKHHEFKAPVAFASTYCTITEHFFSNLAPIVLGVIYLGSHWSLMVSFFCQLELGTLSTHSDFNLPFLHNALQHDWHHYAYTENYGPLGLLDGILGTNKTFKAWLAELKRREKGDWLTKGRVELAEATSD